jgi:Sigma-70 region 2
MQQTFPPRHCAHRANGGTGYPEATGDSRPVQADRRANARRELPRPSPDEIGEPGHRAGHNVPTEMSGVLSIPCVTDAELVDEARSGDSAAFGELVTRHQAAIIRIARIVCRSREEAEDVAQEAFVTAWKRLDSFRGEAQFRSWLLTIAWRHALSRRESVWRRLRRTVSTDDEGFTPPPTPPAPPHQERPAPRPLRGRWSPRRLSPVVAGGTWRRT